MKSAFSRVALKRVAILGTGHTPSRSVPEYWARCTIPWLTLADVGPLRDGTVAVVNETKEKISELGVANSSAVVHPAGTVVMSRTASVGYSAILGTDMATSQDYVSWRCGPQLEPRFLLHSLRGNRDEILASRMGSTHQTIYMPDVERIRIPLPDTDRQRRIADFLDVETARIDALVTAKRQMIEVVRLRFNRWLSRSLAMEVASSGARCKLRYLTVVQGGLTLGKTYAAPTEVFSYLRVANVQDGWLDLHDVATIELPASDSVRYLVRQGDLLVLEGNGNPANLGRGTIYRGELSGPILHQNHVHVVRPGDRLLPEYLELTMRTESVREYITGGSNQVSIATLSQERLGNITVPVPSITEQRDLVRHVTAEQDRTESLARTLSHQIKLLRERRQALISAAVSGELEI